MRIYKFGTKDFKTLDKLRQFFLETLPKRSPPGQILLERKTKLHWPVGERIVFTHRSHVIFTAVAASKHIPSAGKAKGFFVVDLSTLKGHLIHLRSLTERYALMSGRKVNFLAQNGPDLADDEFADDLWKYLRDTEEIDYLGPLDAESESDGHEDTFAITAADSRNRILRQIRLRRGQKKFRDALCNRYGKRCQLTGCDFLPLLEAAHIKEYRGENDNHPANGLLLRSDIHTLFDLDLVTIHPDSLEVLVNRGLPKEYQILRGIKLNCNVSRRPSVEALCIRYARFLARDET